MTLIAHTTDLSGDDAAAFLHASALAAAAPARLVTVHGNAPAGDAAKLPDASVLAARWGRPIAHERRCHECCDDVTDTVLDALRALHPDLVVLGTHARHGLSAWLHASVGEAIARNLDVPALVVPNASRGFVDAQTGGFLLRRVLIPCGTADDASRGLAAARRFLALAQVDETTARLELVHVGEDDAALASSGSPVLRVRGAIEEAIVAMARDHDACLIVMPTHGHDGVGDVLRGSHTERVIRDAPCPVLAIRHA